MLSSLNNRKYCRICVFGIFFDLILILFVNLLFFSIFGSFIFYLFVVVFRFNFGVRIVGFFFGLGFREVCKFSGFVLVDTVLFVE